MLCKAIGNKFGNALQHITTNICLAHAVPPDPKKIFK